MTTTDRFHAFIFVIVVLTFTVLVVLALKAAPTASDIEGDVRPAPTLPVSAPEVTP